MAARYLLSCTYPADADLALVLDALVNGTPDGGLTAGPAGATRGWVVYGRRPAERAERLLRAVSWVSRVNLDPWPSAGPFRVVG